RNIPEARAPVEVASEPQTAQPRAAGSAVVTGRSEPRRVQLGLTRRKEASAPTSLLRNVLVSTEPTAATVGRGGAMGTIASVLADHVSLRIRCVDRIGVAGYVPN